MRCLIVIPTYNEAATIRSLLDTLQPVISTAPGDAQTDVLVVDDSSPDGTGDIIHTHPAFGDRLHLLTRVTKDGLGAAYRAGFAHALATGYDVVVQIDADGSHPAGEIPAMLDLLRTHDLVIGSRYVRGGRTNNWPLRRRILSRAANIYARLVLDLQTRDATSGFRAWNADALIQTGALETSSNGYGFQIENTWRAERTGRCITEHPITFTERTAGKSKMTLDVAGEAARRVLQWRIGELHTARRTRTRRSEPSHGRRQPAGRR